MSYLLIRHKVADYAAWKPVFDAHGVKRKAAGEKNVRRFAESDDLKRAMANAGIVGRPEGLYLEGL